MLGSTRINSPIVTLDNIDLIIDHSHKVVLCLGLLVVQVMLALPYSTVSLLMTRFVAFPTNHFCLLIALVVVVVVVVVVLV